MMEKLSMKKVMVFLLAVTLIASSLLGCSSKPVVTDDQSGNETSSSSETQKQNDGAKSTGVTLEFQHNMTGVITDTIAEVCQDFTNETGIAIEVSAPGTYGEMIKARMASNDMPDIFSTHGWSTTLYKEYLMPLNDQDFVKDIVSSIREMITDEDGNVYVLPADVDLSGMTFNKTVCDEAGINVDEIKTWEDFETACEKVKEIGKTPIHLGGKDNWTIGTMIDLIAPTFYTNNDQDNDRETLLDGSFDWSKWSLVSEMVNKWYENGYFNVDALTADYITSCKALAQDQVAFTFYTGKAVAEALQTNDQADLGFMPIPAKDGNNEVCLIGGEDLAIGLWKDTKYPEETLQFINYLARPEVCSKLATSCGMPAGLEGVSSETGILKPYYEKYMSAEIKTIPYFDRIYLPNGLYEVMCSTGTSILSGQKGAVENSAKEMEQAYKEKMDQR